MAFLLRLYYAGIQRDPFSSICCTSIKSLTETNGSHFPLIGSSIILLTMLEGDTAKNLSSIERIVDHVTRVLINKFKALPGKDQYLLKQMKDARQKRASRKRK